jgi:hypothetical protein
MYCLSKYALIQLEMAYSTLQYETVPIGDCLNSWSKNRFLLT